MAKRYYELHVAGCTRQLPIMNISDTLAIAGFVILGDTEIVTRTAEKLAKKVPEGTDIILTAETKGIPLAHEMARVLGMKKYIVARKSVKAYMEDPICVEDESITTMGKQRLYLSQDDVDLIRPVKDRLPGLENLRRLRHISQREPCDSADPESRMTFPNFLYKR